MRSTPSAWCSNQTRTRTHHISLHSNGSRRTNGGGRSDGDKWHWSGPCHRPVARSLSVPGLTEAATAPHADAAGSGARAALNVDRHCVISRAPLSQTQFAAGHFHRYPRRRFRSAWRCKAKWASASVMCHSSIMRPRTPMRPHSFTTAKPLRQPAKHGQRQATMRCRGVGPGVAERSESGLLARDRRENVE
jgi:hypothetical protein